VGLKAAPPKAAATSETAEYRPADGSGSLVELPVKVAGRAARLGFGVARRTVGVGLEVAGAVTGRLRGLARDR
jgi:hypothetical protein